MKRPKLESEMRRDAGRGVSPFLSDRAFWLGDYDSPWIDALAALDRRGDPAPLLICLRSDTAMTPADSAFVEDLLARRWGRKRGFKNRADCAKFIEHTPPKPGRGRPRVPAYDLSDVELRLHVATWAVRRLVREGMTFRDAVLTVARQAKLNANTLDNFCNARRGVSRRMKARRP